MTLTSHSPVLAEPLLARLEAGRPQIIVAMGTSLTDPESSHWPALLHAWLYERYPGLSEVILPGIIRQLVDASGVEPALPTVRPPLHAVRLVPYALAKIMDPSFILGFEFQVNQPIRVTQLGVFDLESDGLEPRCGAMPIEVGLFDPGSGRRLALVSISTTSPTQPSGAGSRTHFEPLAEPIDLDAGGRFVVAARGMDEPSVYDQAQITYVRGTALGPASARELGWRSR